jgi:2-polyprenyl-3-methyl-5-hydroxy-6-metoxy-1,4-benzoquinol methylase
MRREAAPYRGTEGQRMLTSDQLTAQIEPFDSFWQAPKDVEKGYSQFSKLYKHNFLRHLPENRQAAILVISCGPGYFVNVLVNEGYTNVLGIDSDSAKIRYAAQRNLPCRVERAFEFLQDDKNNRFDAIVCEQELNHLTKKEMLLFLGICRESLKPGGTLFVYGLNGANPITAAENLAHNIDHYNTFTEYSLEQILAHARFQEIRVLPFKLYVFYKNPLNYLAMALDALYSSFFRFSFMLYGKSVKILTKKIAAVCKKGPD